MDRDFLRSIEEFVARPRDPSVGEKVSRFVSAARKKGWVADENVLGLGDEGVTSSSGVGEWTPFHAFFAPVGYRPLFEQEVIFLLNEGFDYEGILKMPVPIRKKLIDKKLELRAGRKRVSQEPDIPPAVLDQMRLAAKMTREGKSPALKGAPPAGQGAEIGA